MRQGMRLAAVVAAFVLAVTTPLRAAAAGDAELDAFIVQQMQEGGIAGLGAAIVVDHQVVWMQGYGQADRARGIAFTPDTTMSVASITKTVTGVAMLRAVQAGQLDLDADIDAYLPFPVRNPAFPDVPITLRQLATHTSGIADRPEVYERAYHYGDDAPESLGDFLAAYFAPGGANAPKDDFVVSRPGTHREYSNIGAALAGYIVERATGERLDALTQRDIFAPLGMTRTRWSIDGIDPGTDAIQYVAQNGITIPIPPYRLATYPDGGLRTSVHDLARLLAALLHGGELDGSRVLDEATVAEMQRFQYAGGAIPDNVDPEQKNSGLFWQTKFGGKMMGHGGNDPGVQAEMLASLDRRIGVVVLSNTSVSEPDMKYFVAVFRKVWERAEGMRR